MMACVCCGLEGVDGVCSMCEGDPNHNTDGEYEHWLEQQAQNEQVEDDPALYPLDTTPDPGYQDAPLDIYGTLSPDAQRILRQMSANPRTDSPMWGKAHGMAVYSAAHKELCDSGVLSIERVHQLFFEFTLTSSGRAVALAYWRAVDMRVKAYMCADWFEDIPF